LVYADQDDSAWIKMGWHGSEKTFLLRGILRVLRVFVVESLALNTARTQSAAKHRKAGSHEEKKQTTIVWLSRFHLENNGHR